MAAPSRITNGYPQTPYVITHRISSFKVFIHRNGLNFAPFVFRAIGGGLTVSGIGIMDYSKKLKSTTLLFR